MAKLAFIITHLGSGYLDLVKTLSQAPRLQFEFEGTYTSTDLVLDMMNKPHKCKNTAKIHGGIVLQNHCFSVSSAHEFAKFIFLVKSPKSCFKELREHFQTDSACAEYYARRLRRMSEMLNKVNNYFVLNYEEIINPLILSELSNFLSLKFDLKSETNSDVFVDFKSKEALERCNRAYIQFNYVASALAKQR